MDDGAPSQDDERLRDHASALADAVDAVLAEWVVRCVRDRCVGSGVGVVDGRLDPDVAADATAAGARCRDEVGGAVRELLARDIDDQDTTPLTLLRDAVRYPTAVLEAAGVPPVVRDEFRERSFPGDRYDLAPASFGAVDPSLHEPGLVWGAAKAHVHLRRRAGG